MNKLFYLITLVIFTVACVSQNKPVMNKYKEEWAKIEQFRQQGLPQSILSHVDTIYRAALAEKNYEQLIKALIFRMNGMGVVMEDDEGANRMFRTLKSDAEMLPQPARSVVYSMLGQMYEEYCEQNMWTFSGRTNVATVSDDVHTWDMRRLTEESIRYYQLSLQDGKTLQNEPVNNYRDILSEGYDSICQPTLYDMLAKRALTGFSTAVNTVSLPQKVFLINDPAYFADAREFVKLEIQTPDSLSCEYLSLKIYQELLRFHLEKSGHGTPAGEANGDMTALTEIDLRRMAFLKEKGRYADNEKLYEKALIGMSESYGAYTQNTRVLLQLARFYLDRGQAWRDNKSEENKPGYTKALQICERIEREYPGREEDNVKALKETIRNKEIALQVEESQLPGKPFLAQLKFRNMNTLYQMTYKLTEQEAINCKVKEKDIPTFILLLKREPERKQIRLPETPDLQYYTTEIKIDPLEKGYYLVVFSASESPLHSSDVWTSVFIQASSLMTYDRKINNSRTVVVTDRENGAPVSGAKITTYLDTAKAQISFVSDENGIASGYENTDYKYSASYYTVAKEDEKLLVFNPWGYGMRYVEGEYDSGVLFTDRSIYRPGQTVYFKAILYRGHNGNWKLQKGKTVKAQLKDVNRQVVAEKDVTSNEFGSVEGSFTIPQGLLNGNMIITCTDYVTASIRVEEYRRPTFEVKFNPVEGNIALNGQVTATANAKALAGYAVDNAEVRYRIVRNSICRYNRYPPLDDAEREIASGSLKTDEKGDFSIRFDALADDVTDDGMIYTFTVTADVTDINGETHSASLNVRAGNKPLLVTANLPEEITPGEEDVYTVETTNLNGEFTPASVKVEIISLRQPSGILRNRIWKDEKIDLYTIPEEEFRRDFPLDAYGDELNPENFRELSVLSRYTIETANDTKLDLSALKRPGYYKVKLTADNRAGITADNTLYVCIPDNRPGNMDQWIRTVKATGEAGENAEFQISGGAENSHVYCELFYKDKFVEARWIKVGVDRTSVTYPIRKAYRGGFDVQFSMIRDNRKYSEYTSVVVPFTNKMLDIKLATFRDKLLPGEKETWTMKVSDKKNRREAAEIVASLYDASLDAFRPHRWADASVFYHQQRYEYIYQWHFNAIERYALPKTYNNTPFVAPRMPDVFPIGLNWFDRTYRNALYANTSSRSGNMMVRGLSMDMSSAPLEEVVVVGFGKQKKASMVGAVAARPVDMQEEPAAPEVDLTAVQTRTNFNETAFFYPQLRTNEQGETLIEFTMPEALTRWKLLSFAHTEDFKVGSYTGELVTQKQVAVSANPPRFFRENDMITFTAKVNNLTAEDLSGQALLSLCDALTMQPVDAVIRSEKTLPFSVRAGESAGLSWTLAIPDNIRAITCRLTARAGTHTDGEETTIPVLTNSILVTETMPFSVRAGEEKTFTFDRLAGNKSKTLRNHRLTLEFTSAPAWYAVQALPCIMEYPYECAEQTFSRYYANTLATAITRKTPRIRQIFDLWRTFDSDALTSNLEKNQELKQVMLQETPWVMQADGESERKKRIALLFDLNRMSGETKRALVKLEKMQNSDGGFPWFDGLPSDRYITQHIVAGIAHLERLDAMPPENASGAATVIQRGRSFLDDKIAEDHRLLLERKANMEEQQIGSLQLHYLYACSFGAYRPGGKAQAAFNFYVAQAGQFWKNFSAYGKAQAALILHRYGEAEKAAAIIRSLREHAQQSDELGMYWKDNVAGYFWYQAPIETQAVLIEAFSEVAADADAVEAMKIWLLRNKQANDWQTTKATAEAVYALLMTGDNLLDESKLPEVELAGRPLSKVATEEIRPEPGTGYVKTAWQGRAITARMGHLKVKNPNRRGVMWGGMYWQYFEQLDRITAAETDLKMNKQLFLRTLTDRGETLQPIDGNDRLRVGDLVRVRMELRADRDYEYVHLKDLRASGLEPVSTRSGNRHQGGLWYYESVKDASVNFFIHSLRKGVYVFEYDLRVSHAGDFSNGITSFQCMYAPEFSAHSAGIRIAVDASERQ
jgi:uncharacterized protein YfaS (alpha-2-macroglobulin family)